MKLHELIIAIASRQQQRDRLAELEQKVKQLEDEVNTQQKECDDWRQKYQTLENKCVRPVLRSEI